MEYLFDTVTIIHHFSGMGKIGKKAKNILDKRPTINIYKKSIYRKLMINFCHKEHDPQILL